MEDEEGTNRDRKKNQKEVKGKQETEVKQDKADSVFVAREIISCDVENVGKWLLQLRGFKNPNYDKFSDRIYQNIKKSDFSFDGSVDRFIQISLKATEENTTGHQMGSILKGFSRFWKEWKISQLESIQHLFAHLYSIYPHVSRLFVSCCYQLLQINFNEQIMLEFSRKALEMANKFIKSNSRADQPKIIPLIYEFDLYKEVTLSRVVDLALRHHSITQILYLFRTHAGAVREELLRLFVDRCVINESKNDLTKCEKVVRDLGADPFKYDNYITKMQQRYIAYLTRTYKLFFIQLLIQHDRKLIGLLIEDLMRQRRERELRYFIFHYKFEQEFNIHFGNKQQKELGSIRNVLWDCDKFGPTQVDVLEQQDPEQNNYLYMWDFGLQQADVVFIDSDNIEQIEYRQQLTGGMIGIDSERAGGVHVFDPSQTQIVQIFTGKKVLIFDYAQLRHHPIFKQIVVFIYSNCKIYGQDIQKELTAMQRETKAQVEEKVMQELMRSRVIDSNKVFKQTFPKESKSSLAYQCEFVFKKKLSKYEQCSGWKNRPLRKAQLHYAALDCVVPYKVCEQLGKLGKKK